MTFSRFSKIVNEHKKRSKVCRLCQKKKILILFEIFLRKIQCQNLWKI